MIHTTLHVRSTMFPSLSYSKSTNSKLSGIYPSFNFVNKGSNITTVLSFQEAGWPHVVAITLRVWSTVTFYVLEGIFILKPLCSVWAHCGHANIPTCVASDDPIQPLNPAERKRDSRSATLVVIFWSSTHFLYKIVLPYSIKEYKNTLFVSSDIALASEISSNVHPQPMYRRAPRISNFILVLPWPQQSFDENFMNESWCSIS